jgi:uncharacterized protein
MSILSPRFYRIQFFKILRSAGTPEYIARSVFCGVFAGLTVPLLQIPIAILVAWLFKANKTIASLSTFVSNPLTYPIFWFSALYIGSFFIPGNEQFLADCQKHFFELSFWINLDWWKLGGSTILMFITGGAILGLILGSFAYYWTKNKVIKKRAKRRQNERTNKAIKEVE